MQGDVAVVYSLLLLLLLFLLLIVRITTLQRLQLTATYNAIHTTMPCVLLYMYTKQPCKTTMQNNHPKQPFNTYLLYGTLDVVYIELHIASFQKPGKIAYCIGVILRALPLFGAESVHHILPGVGVLGG